MGKTEDMVADAIVPGPLGHYAPGFREWLPGQGYRPCMAVFHLRLMGHVSTWMDQEGLELSGLTRPP